MKKHTTLSIKFVAYTGLMTAIVYVCTLVGVTTPIGNFNVGDSAILITAALFNPLTAMIAGGLGAFLADLTTYPATMLYTLVIKAIEGLVAGIAFSLIYKFYNKIQHPTKKDKIVKIVLATLTSIICTGFMVLAYYVCKALMYGTPESALTSLPKNIVQAVVSVIVSTLVLYVARLEKMRSKTQLVPIAKDKHEKNFNEMFDEDISDNANAQTDDCNSENKD